MLLAIDVGNTNIVLGVFAGDTLVQDWRIATDTRRMPDEYAVYLHSLLNISKLDASSIDGVVICSVVPSVQTAITETSIRYWGVEPLIVTAGMDLGFEIRYSPRQAVGADRIANAVATIRKYGAPAVVVDFGTATTLDAISPEAAYLGGAIAPGLEISEEALIHATAQLPHVPLSAPETFIGVDTVSSLQSGILFGYAGLVDGLVDGFRRELGPDTTVIATGGLAKIVAPHTRTIQHVDPDLTLLGLQLIFSESIPHAVKARVRQA